MRSSFKSALVATSIALGATLYAGGVMAAEQANPSEAHSSDMTKAVSDTWITTKVKAELATTEGVNSTDISVKTTNGVVTLIGVLPDDTMVQKAVAAAKSVEGVQAVDDAGLKAK